MMIRVLRSICHGAVLWGRPVFVVLVLLLACPPAESLAETPQNVVRYVIDGDTFVTAANRKVRLAAIDAPERATAEHGAGYYAEDSRKCLEELVLGRTVRLAPAGGSQDRYGRTLSLVELADGRSLQDELVTSGCVFVSWHRDTPPKVFERLLQLQQAAMRAGKGFWPVVLGRSAARRPQVGNAGSLRFAPEDCPDSGRIGKRNRRMLPDAEQAFERGYAPNRNCDFWPKAEETEREGVRP